jgi:hypothetical protein
VEHEFIGAGARPCANEAIAPKKNLLALGHIRGRADADAAIAKPDWSATHSHSSISNAGGGRRRKLRAGMNHMTT